MPVHSSVTTFIESCFSQRTRHSQPRLLSFIMASLLDYPSILFLVSVVLLSTTSVVGALFRRVLMLSSTENDEKQLSLILSATLTLLGLIIGFTFSMAVNRYD